MNTENSRKQVLLGTVEKISSSQTVRFSIKVTKVHPIYKKRYTQARHYIAHDPEGSCKVGDLVKFEACKPISKNKHWIVANRLTEGK